MISKEVKKLVPVSIRNLYRELEFRYNYRAVRKRNQEKIMIIGCGRSGTTYTSKLFKSFGYEVGHERLGKNGISSWMLVSDQTQVPIGPSFKDLRSLELPIVHQVRHPIKAISSLQATGHISWKFLASE
ncbi:MAG: hypothetical protein AAFN81_06895, partial [Bacteroidota bacterium]